MKLKINNNNTVYCSERNNYIDKEECEQCPFYVKTIIKDGRYVVCVL
jgi:predicted nucleic acid-binding Zn finger protein